MLQAEFLFKVHYFKSTLTEKLCPIVLAEAYINTDSFKGTV